MSFQLSILKVLDGQPAGCASLDVIKQSLAILYTSGPDWTTRMKRLAELVPNIDIFSEKLVVREPGVWRITDKGRLFLTTLERTAAAAPDIASGASPSATFAAVVSSLPAATHRALGHRKGKQKRRRRHRGKRSA